MTQTITLQQIEKDFAIVMRFMKAMSEARTTFFEAKILMVNRLGITFGEAEDRLLSYEKISGITLPRAPQGK